MTLPNLEERLLYRDALMLVLDKPAGVPVHKGTGGGVNLEQGFDALRFGLPRPPALAHRLDKDTSGCLVLGRHRQALHKLGKLFASNRIQKTYWAVVEGTLPEAEGRIDIPLRKQSPEKSRWRMVADADGDQTAITDYKVMGTHDGLSWVEFKPQTGRTHQLRVHAAALGCPIVGDYVYGREGKMLHLQARALEIPLYASKPPIQVVAEPPEHMREALVHCGFAIAK